MSGYEVFMSQGYQARDIAQELAGIGDFEGSAAGYFLAAQLFGEAEKAFLVECGKAVLV